MLKQRSLLWGSELIRFQIAETLCNNTYDDAKKRLMPREVKEQYVRLKAVSMHFYEEMEKDFCAKMEEEEAARSFRVKVEWEQERGSSAHAGECQSGKKRSTDNCDPLLWRGGDPFDIKRVWLCRAALWNYLDVCFAQWSIPEDLCAATLESAMKEGARIWHRDNKGWIAVPRWHGVSVSPPTLQSRLMRGPQCPALGIFAYATWTSVRSLKD